MLDQNTDRMWFVIGAVIVGATIIFIANGTLPTLFASVSDSFEETADKGTEVISNLSYIGENMIDYSKHTVYENKKYDEVTGEIIPNTGGWYSIVGDIQVVSGTTYRFHGDLDMGSAVALYYDSNGDYLGSSEMASGMTAGITFTTPPGTKMIRVAAGDIRFRAVPLPAGTSSTPVEDWILERLY